MYKSVDVDIDIEFDDIMEYITDHASSSEIRKSQIMDLLGHIFEKKRLLS